MTTTFKPRSPYELPRTPEVDAHYNKAVSESSAMNTAKLVQTRVKDGVHYDLSTLEKEWSKVITHLMINEICFGGKVTHLGANKVVVETSVMGCIDTITIEGTVEELAAVTEMAKCLEELDAAGPDQDTPILSRKELSEDMPPEVVNVAYNLVAGLGRSKKVAIMMLGFVDTPTLDLLCGATRNDLLALLELKLSGVTNDELVFLIE